MNTKSTVKARTEMPRDTYISIIDCGMSGSDALSSHTVSRVTQKKNGNSVYSIVFAEKGSISSVIGREDFTAGQGSIILFYPEAPWNIICNSSDTLYRYIDFKGYAVPEILAQCGIFQSGVYNISDARIASDALSRIMIAKSRNESEIRAVSLFMILLSEITLSEKTQSLNNASDISCLEKLRNAISLMDAEYKSARKIAEYAEICGMTSGRFSTIFEKATGKTPKKYIEDKKIDKACELLIHTAMTVSSAALCSGFCDSLYFSRVFKKKLGMSPTEYRKLSSL